MTELPTPASGDAPAALSTLPPVLPTTVPECHVLIGQLLERVQALEERVKLNSSNSSKPPSSDGPGKPNRAQRRASNRKRGAQPGHKGSFRTLVDASEVDRIVDCRPESLCECGAAVLVSEDEPQRHQVFEVPPIRAQIDEYRRYSGRCTGCGKWHLGALPAGVPSGQLGPRALSLVGVLSTAYHLTQRKICGLLDQVLGLRFSVGAISQAHGKVANALRTPVAEAVASLPTAPALWMDETSYPREGFSSHWAWAVVQPQLAVFAIYPSRARYVVNDLIGPNCTAVVTTDRYASYAHLDPERRQVCWAHLVRDVTRIAQRAGQAGRVGHRLLGLALVMFRWHDQGKLAGTKLQRLQKRMREALQRGVDQARCQRTARTCANLIDLWPALWTFTTDARLEPTNNAAERALRPLVLKRKISGPTRSRRGDQFLSYGYTAYETCRRQGRDLWHFMHGAVHALIAGTAPPSLIPQAAPTG